MSAAAGCARCTGSFTRVGDRASIGAKTPLDDVNTVYFAYPAKLMREMAAAIGKTTENSGELKKRFPATHTNHYTPNVQPRLPGDE